MNIDAIVASTGNMQVLIFALLALVFIVRLLGKRPKRRIGGKFRLISHLNTKAEQNFFKQFNGKLPEQFYIAPKVRLADLCKPEDPKNIIGFNKIARKHVDFVVMERESSRVMCVVELDDRSHQRKDSARRDREKDYALSSAGIALHRVKATRNYAQAIEKIISQLGPSKGHNYKHSLSKVCARCGAETELNTMGWPNRNKAYLSCRMCDWKTEPFVHQGQN